jgi:hypothetical protein
MTSGIHFVTDTHGKPVAVQIDLRKHKGLWQDFYDALQAESRRNEPHAAWDDVKKRLKDRKKKLQS